VAEQDWLSGSNPGMQPASTPAYGAPPILHELRPLTTGEILDRTFFLYRSNFWLYVGLASIAAGMSVLASIARLAYLHYTNVPATSPRAVAAGSAFSIAGALIYFVVYSLTHAATVSAVSSIYLGESTSMERALNAVKSHWLRYCLIALWQGWSAGWIFFLLIAPVFGLAVLGIRNAPGVAAVLVFLAMGGLVYGLIAYIRNSLAIPAAVIEDLPVRSAIGRSKRLVAGGKGRIFLLLLLLFALYFVAGALQMPLALMLLRSRATEHVIEQFLSLFVGFLCSSLIGPVASIALCLFYFDERVRKEAFDIEFLMDKTLPGAGAPTGGATGDATVELA
jgi:hypothetical protein